jgi:predicted DCC family thiol-disulfide oxidoreductase YuxK
MNAEPEAMNESEAIVLFDGVCNFCSGSVLFIIKRDPEGYFRFAALQTEAGEKIMQQYGIGEDRPESIILVEHGRVWYRSSAALRIARKLRRGWPLFYAFIIIPPVIRDFFYNIIAKNRYKWFGRKESCFVPTDEIRERFF